MFEYNLINKFIRSDILSLLKTIIKKQMINIKNINMKKSNNYKLNFENLINKKIIYMEKSINSFLIH